MLKYQWVHHVDKFKKFKKIITFLNWIVYKLFKFQKNNDRTDITAFFILTSVQISKVHHILYWPLNFRTIKCSSGHNSFDNGSTRESTNENSINENLQTSNEIN